MNDNFYAFSYNQTLLNLNAEQLMKEPNLRIKYMQVDSMNKCVPQDWFLGYDQFAVYTFHKLAGQIDGQAGYLKTYFRPGKKMINLLNNLEVLNVNYSSDFIGNLNQDDSHFYMSYLWMRLRQLFSSLLDLALCYCIISFTSYLFHTLLYKVCQEADVRYNFGKFVIGSTILLLIRMLPYTLAYKQNPFSTALISLTCLLSHNFSMYVLEHSRYQMKYKFWMLTACFLNYFYLKTYPYCNVTLTNIVFVTFSLYQFAHNLFKFSYHFESVIRQLQAGTLSAVLPAYIQNELQERFTSRNLRLQFEAQRVQRE
jgi:hypothetical protein